jgi:hypothetical protein
MNQVNKRNKYVLIALIVCTVILVLEIAWIMLQKKPEDVHNEVQVGMEPTVTQETQMIPAASEETGAIQEPDVTETTEQKSDETVPNEKPSETSKPQNNTGSSFRLPYSIPGSDLVIEQINSYDGLFFEDGSDKEVSNVTAMVLTNMGDDCAEYIEITLARDGVKLKFIASALEPGGRMIILEANRKQFKNGTYSNCVADVATSSEFTMSENQVRVEENAEGGLLVTNITGKDIPCIRIFYKFYMTDSDVYVGGITYTAKVTDLAAGASCTITPSHYLKGYSKIVMVKTYDMGA